MAEIEIRDEPLDENEPKPEIPLEISILPLRDSVVYPMLIAPLSVGRPASIRLIDETVVGSNRVIGVVTQIEPTIESPTAFDVYKFGCAVIVRTLVKMPDGVRLIVQGAARFRIQEIIQEEPFLKARIQVIESRTQGFSLHVKELGTHGVEFFGII